MWRVSSDERARRLVNHQAPRRHRAARRCTNVISAMLLCYWIVSKHVNLQQFGWGNFYEGVRKRIRAVTVEMNSSWRERETMGNAQLDLSVTLSRACGRWGESGTCCWPARTLLLWLICWRLMTSHAERVLIAGSREDAASCGCSLVNDRNDPRLVCAQSLRFSHPPCAELRCPCSQFFVSTVNCMLVTLPCICRRQMWRCAWSAGVGEWPRRSVMSAKSRSLLRRC